MDELSKIAEDSLTPEQRAYIEQGLIDHVNREYAAGRVAGAEPGEKSPFEKPREKQWKRLAKAGLAAGGGYVLGHAGGMLADKALSTAFKSRYPSWSPDFKRKVLFPLLGLSMAGMAAASFYTNDKRYKVISGE